MQINVQDAQAWESVRNEKHCYQSFHIDAKHYGELTWWSPQFLDTNWPQELTWWLHGYNDIEDVYLSLRQVTQVHTFWKQKNFLVLSPIILGH